MNIIYLDTLFFINLICDYLLLLCSARICGTEIQRTHIIIASCIGGIYACLCTFPSLTWILHPLVKCASSILLCLIAFWNVPHLPLCTCTFLLISFAAGGLFTAMSIAIGNVLYIPLDFKSILAAFLLLYGIFTLIFRKLPTIQKRSYKQVHILFNGNSVHFTALVDTGNELYDPITNLPVLVCAMDALIPLFPNLTTNTTDSMELYLALTEQFLPLGGFKLIPYQTIGDSGLLVGFHPDAITIDDVQQNAIVGISPIQFSKNEPYQAIY